MICYRVTQEENHVQGRRSPSFGGIFTEVYSLKLGCRIMRLDKVAVETPMDTETRPFRTRSKISSGAALFRTSAKGNPVDMRTAFGRRFQDLVKVITLDLGGPDLLSENQRQIIRRIAILAVNLEAEEAKALSGEGEFDAAKFAIISNHMRRLAESLGLKRVPKNVNAVGNIVGNIKNGKSGGGK
jgi:hypothetical protein